MYVVATALSLPGAVILTLAGGAIFGLGWGLLIVSFASSAGATLAFLAARFVLRDSIEAPFGNPAEVNRGHRRRRRLLPVHHAPHPGGAVFCDQPGHGPDADACLTFYGVSQLGMLAGTAVFVNAGTQLARRFAAGHPVTGAAGQLCAAAGGVSADRRRIVEAVQKRKVYAKWRAVRPRRFDRNLIVIGAGAGGLVSAYIAAAVRTKGHAGGGAQDGRRLPELRLRAQQGHSSSAKLAHQMRHGHRYLQAERQHAGLQLPGRHGTHSRGDCRHRAARQRGALRRPRVEVLQGYAKIVNPWTVEIALNDGGKQVLTTRNIVIAAGARPLVPPLPGLNEVGYVTSDTLWDTFANLDEVPRRLVVLGGGPDRLQAAGPELCPAGFGGDAGGNGAAHHGP